MSERDDWLFGPPGQLVARPEPRSKAAAAQHRSEARRLETMHGRHGHAAPGLTCRSCGFLIHDGRYLKCQRYGRSRAAATDWRAKWPACGAWTARVPAVPAD